MSINYWVRPRVGLCLTGLWRKYSAKSSSGVLKYCVELVKKHDYDHYLCCLLLPKEAQSAGFAVRAFNVEVAQIKDTVSDVKLGEMRIQFWKDAVTNIYDGNVPSQPVAIALAHAIRRHKLSKMWFTRLLEARSAELKVQSYMRTQDLENYAEHTNSSLLYLTLEALGVHDVNVDHAASHLGKAEGIVTMLRASPYHRASRRASLPMDILMRHSTSQEEFIRGDVTQNMKDAVFDFSSLAHIHLQKMRNLKESIPKLASRAFLPAVPCDVFLKRIQHCDFNPFDPVLSRRPSLLSLSLLRAVWTNRF